MFSDAVLESAERLLKECEKRGVMLAVAESCTGGLIAALLTEIPGASRVLDRGFVTYSNAAKIELLGVRAALIKQHGAVSMEVASAMAEGALKNSAAHIALSVTGIAGPGGGTKEKPVGLVYIAAAGGNEKTVAEEHRFRGGRSAVRLNAAGSAFALLSARLACLP
jgi:nicotinamide-nucleotide amidase